MQFIQPQYGKLSTTPDSSGSVRPGSVRRSLAAGPRPGQSAVKMAGLVDEWMINREIRQGGDTSLPSFTPSAVGVIPDNEMYLPTLLTMIDSAKESIKVDCFYIGGPMGEKVLEHLERAAERGVKVYYRGDICQGLDNKAMVVPTLHKLKRFNRNLARFFYYEHFRRDAFQVVGVNHNKLFIVDNNTAFVSTKNPCEGDKDNRDVSLLLRGAVVTELTRHFNRSWLEETRYVLSDKPGRYQELPEFIKPLMRVQNCRPVVTSSHRRNALKAMLKMIRSAEQSLYIHAFALTNREIIEALKEMVVKNPKLKVKVLLDNHETYPLRIPNAVVFQELLELQNHNMNFEVKVYKHKSLHGKRNLPRHELHRMKNHNKMMVVDESRAIVGSTNFTNADVWHQENISIELEGGTAPKALAKVFDDDWSENSLAVKPLTFLERCAAWVVRKLYEF